MAMHDPLHRPLQAAIAVELREMRPKLESLAETLVGDEHFVARYLDCLQMFDWLGQLTDESADLLDRIAAGTPAMEAIAPVRLGIVQARLLDAVAPTAAAA